MVTNPTSVRLHDSFWMHPQAFLVKAESTDGRYSELRAFRADNGSVTVILLCHGWETACSPGGGFAKMKLTTDEVMELGGALLELAVSP